MKYLMQRQLGFSLVEIMVGMTLGLFLTIGIIQLYIGSNRNYRFQEEFSRIQENGRFALELLTNSIRMANFTGCLSTNNTSVTNVLNDKNLWWQNTRHENASPDLSGTLVGFDGNQNFLGRAFGSNIGDRIKVPDEPEDQKTPDAIISLGSTGSYSVTATDPLTLTLAQIQKINGGNIQKGDILWICDDTDTVLFQVTDINGNTITHADFLKITFEDNLSKYVTEVTEYVPTAFYIGVSSSGTSRSLFQMQLEVTLAGVASMKAQEMIEGVENMQIFYGVDTDTDLKANEYKDASDVDDEEWKQVVSVRIELLLASMEDDVLSQPQAYFFPNDRSDSAINGSYVLATDRRWYQTFSTTIGIRNRSD